MSRYSSTKINKSNRGPSYQKADNKIRTLAYRTTIYEDVPEKDTDIYITTQHGDRLDNLAMAFYGSSQFWWFIGHVNNITTINVEAGLTLRIPATVDKAIGK